MARPTDTLKNRFGNLLASNRKQRSLTQEALATAAGLSVDTIKKLEGGRAGASFEAIEQLAQALGIDPLQLFSPMQGNESRRALVDLMSELTTMSDAELNWVRDVIGIARRRP